MRRVDTGYIFIFFYMFSFPYFIYVLSCSKTVCGLRPIWPQRTAHHHHQAGHRASHFHWLVPGLGSQHVGHGSIGQNPCQILNIRKALFSSFFTYLAFSVVICLSCARCQNQLLLITLKLPLCLPSHCRALENGNHHDCSHIFFQL